MSAIGQHARDRGADAECIGGPLDGEMRVWFRGPTHVVNEISKGEWAGRYVLSPCAEESSFDARTFRWEPE